MDDTAPGIVIASILRPEGSTGVHTHIRELQKYLKTCGQSATIVTPFTRRPRVASLAFAPRLAIEPCNGAASVLWYRHWHGLFLEAALRRALSSAGDVVVYAQGPEAAGAALRARQGQHQRVVMGVHFQGSQADGWADKGSIERGGRAYRAIKEMERQVIPCVDGLVFVSKSAREHMLAWLPEAAAVPSEVIPNFVAPVEVSPLVRPLGDLVTIGSLDRPKNHRFLLAVLAEANKMGERLSLDIFGEGPARKELQQSVTSLGLTGQVRLQGIRMDVRKLLPHYHAYVHAAESETGPLAIIEAMAAGLPVFAGAVASIPELYDDGVEGRFWPLDDTVTAARTLVTFLRSSTAPALASAAALARFESHFSANVAAPRLAGFLRGEFAANLAFAV